MIRKRGLHVLITCLLLSVALVLAVSGCYAPGGPVPEEAKPPTPRAWTPEQVAQAVVTSQETIYSPAPTGNGVPPDECNYIHFLRFRPRDYSGNPQDADAILVLMPGLLCGSNSFEYLGPQMVYMAKTQRNINLEVWGTERRGNDLEDRTGVMEAEAGHDDQAAIDYYYHGARINGKQFAGFLTDPQVPYLSEFGLKLYMEDVYKVITTMLPDPQARRQKLFVGGHSMGGFLTAFFAGWDFDGDPATLDDAGYRNCAGYVALDSVIMASNGTASQQLKKISSGSMPEQPADMSEEEYYSILVQGLKDGTVPRIFQFPGVTQEAMLLLEFLGMDANFAPDAESTLLKRMPISDSLATLLNILHSRSLEHYLIHSPTMTDFRFTNEAQFGIVLDDNFMPVTIMQASMGFLKGGPVVIKDFPFPHDFANIPAFVQLIGGFLCLKDLFIANDAGPDYLHLGQGPLYSWANYDQVGDSADPDYQDTLGTLTYTTATNEVSDIQDVARILYSGPSNLPEWYFASRLILDVQYGSRAWAQNYGISFLHGDHIDDNPKIELLAEQGPMKSMLGWEPPPHDRIPGYNHIDVLTAAADRPSHRQNEVFMPVIDFMLQHRVLPPSVKPARKGPVSSGKPVAPKRPAAPKKSTVPQKKTT
jgi:pimeloyl-ACP methyl ester carboxylesterase